MSQVFLNIIIIFVLILFWLFEYFIKVEIISLFVWCLVYGTRLLWIEIHFNVREFLKTNAILRKILKDFVMAKMKIILDVFYTENFNMPVSEF